MTAQINRPAPEPAATGGDGSNGGETRIVVVGGGVAGVMAAYELRRRLGNRAQITLVSQSERFLLGLALPWVPFGRTTNTMSFPLARPLQRRGIAFVHAYAEHVSVERRIVLAGQRDIPYDYLLITTGPRADSPAIPGVTGQFNATETIWKERSAVEAGHALERFLAQPGPVVIGAAQGAAYLSGAYEFALLLDYELRRGTGSRDDHLLSPPSPTWAILTWARRARDVCWNGSTPSAASRPSPTRRLSASTTRASTCAAVTTCRLRTRCCCPRSAAWLASGNHQT